MNSVSYDKPPAPHQLLFKLVHLWANMSHGSYSELDLLNLWHI